MAKTYKVLSAILSYPTAELQAAAPGFLKILEDEDLLPGIDRRALAPVLEELVNETLYELQERYVFLFDRTRSLSLHLFEHVHGESRERGQAMVDLADHYAQHGLEILARELPDHLPLFLEFLSILPAEEAREFLEQPLHIISALSERLQRRDSSYAGVLRALETLSRRKPEASVLQALLDEAEDDPADLPALDEIWEETEVLFGPGAADDDSCPQVSEMLVRMGTDPAERQIPADSE